MGFCVEVGGDVSERVPLDASALALGTIILEEIYRCFLDVKKERIVNGD